MIMNTNRIQKVILEKNQEIEKKSELSFLFLHIHDFNILLLPYMTAKSYVFCFFYIGKQHVLEFFKLLS